MREDAETGFNARPQQVVRMRLLDCVLQQNKAFTQRVAGLGSEDDVVSVPPGQRRTARVPRPKPDPFIPIIRGWLAADQTMPQKQRHTAQRLFDRSGMS